MRELHLVLLALILVLSSAPVDTRLIDNCPHNLPRDRNLWTYGGVCLQVVTHKKDWDDARSDCHRRHGELIQIRDSGMQNSVARQLQSLNYKNHGFWIGATDRNHEGRWEWVTGMKSMPYSNWHPGQGPSQSGFLFSSGSIEDCAQLRTNDRYRWHDYPCAGGVAYHYYYICQYAMLPTTTKNVPKTTTMPPTTTTLCIPTVTTTEYRSPTTTKFHKRTTTKFHPRTTTKFHSRTTTKFHSPTTTKFHSPTTTTLCPPTMMMSTSPSVTTTMSPTTTTAMSPTTTKTMSPTTTTTRSPTTTTTMSPTTTTTISPTTTTTMSPTTTTTMSPTTTTTMSPTTTTTMSPTTTTTMSPTTTTTMAPTTTERMRQTTTVIRQKTTHVTPSTTESEGHVIGGNILVKRKKQVDGVSDALKSSEPSDTPSKTTIIIIGALGVVGVGIIASVAVILVRRRRSIRRSNGSSGTYERENPLYGITMPTSFTETENNAYPLHVPKQFTLNLDESVS